MKKEELKALQVINAVKKDTPKVFDGHYSPVEIMGKNTAYKMVVSKRSDGKTYAFRYLIYYAWQKYSYTSVIVRRLAESIKSTMVKNDFEKIFKNHPNINFKKYDGIGYYNGVQRGFWLDDKGKKKYDVPFCEYLAVSNQETTKSSKDYVNLFMVLFDEICSRGGFLPDEFNAWCNLLSTILREQLNAVCVMLGNPVSWVSPYFSNYGIEPLKVPENTIQIYVGEKETTSIAFEKVGEKKGNTKIKAVNDRFFGFKNQKIKSITTGIWETPMYPRLKKQTHEKVVFDKLFAKMDNVIIRLQLCSDEQIGLFVRVHEFYDVSFYDDDIVLDVSEQPIINKNVYTRFSNKMPCVEIIKIYNYLYLQDRYFYSDNMIGETTRLFFEQFTSNKPKYL